QLAGAEERLAMVEAPQKHGLSLPLREAIYAFFDRWLGGRKVEDKSNEIAVKPRPANELLVCKEGQVNVTFKSQHLLTLALEDFDAGQKRAGPRAPLTELLRLDPAEADYRSVELAGGGPAVATLLVCINGNEGRPLQDETAFLTALMRQGDTVVAIDPRGVG